MKTKMKHLSQKFALLVSAPLVTAAFAIPAALAGSVVGGSVPVKQSSIDYANAIPMPLPQSPIAPDQEIGAALSESFGVPGHTSGAVGNGKTNPIKTPVSKWVDESADLDFEKQEYGTSNHPFTTSRVDLPAVGVTGNTLANGVSLRYPYRVTGKLFFNRPDGTFVCTASLIKRGVIVTAAHCVADYGKKKLYSNWKFHPAYYKGTSPYGIWSVNGVWVMISYFNGTDTCASGASGIVCKNDIAVLRVAPSSTSPTYPGTATGWYSYGYNGYGFTPGNIALFNQLGYPSSLDSGVMMQRTDSHAFVSSILAGNSVWGSLQTGGSSGGPDLVNFGISPVLSGGITHGAEAVYNTVVGVTSWGYGGNQAIKQQGASPFLSTNIVPLVNAVCAPTPAVCQ